LLTILLTIVILGLMILVHEAGHFLAARWRGVRVVTFSVGFGPRVWGIRRGDTDYIISAIPFGGYVKMAGDDPDEAGGGLDEFLSRPLRDRFAIILAGPVANFVLGFLLFLAAALPGRDYIPGNQVFAVKPDSPAERSGLQAGDKIIRIRGKPFHDWEDLPRGKADLVVLRGADTVEIAGAEADGMEPYIPPVLGKTIPQEPAAKAGLAQGDTVLAVDSLRVVSWNEMVAYIRQNPEKEIGFTLKRGPDTLAITVLTSKQATLENGKEEQVGAIGVLAPMEKKRVSVLTALGDAIFQTFYAAGFIFFILLKLVTGGISPGSIGGPVMIGKVVGQSWGLGFLRLLSTAALISVNLAVVNLLPIPALDGGHLTIFSIEGITRRKIPAKWHLRIQIVGFALVLAVMVAVTVMDVKRIFFP